MEAIAGRYPRYWGHFEFAVPFQLNLVQRLSHSAAKNEHVRVEAPLFEAFPSQTYGSLFRFRFDDFKLKRLEIGP